MSAEHQVSMIWIEIGVFLVSIFGMWYKMNRDTNMKIDSISGTFSKQLAAATRDAEEKRSRIYKRVDEVKEEHKQELNAFRKEVADNFVPTRICTIMHTASDKIMTELKEAIHEIDKKVDRLIAKVYENSGGK